MGKSNIGIIGSSGRMGQVLRGALAEHTQFVAGKGYSHETRDTLTLAQLFSESDYVVDFSHASLVEEIITAAIDNPKPLVICTTGWDQEALTPKLKELSGKAPLIIASNTSIGAIVQRYLVRKLATILGDEFDIDVHEKHHRFKVDSPSGTAISLVEEIQEGKRERGQEYELYYVGNSAREERQIGMSVQRAGSIVGEHDVSFTSLSEQIVIRHNSFDRALFAQGAIKALEWLNKEQLEGGIYTMFDVLNLK